jgi:hypothetical protein
MGFKKTPKPPNLLLIENIYISLTHSGNLQVKELVEAQDVMYLQQEDVYIDHSFETAACMIRIHGR